MPICARLELDGSRSLGFAGRSWSKVQWELISLNTGDNTDYYLSNVLNASSNPVLKIFPQPNSTMSEWMDILPVGTYIVRLTLQNWANATSSGVFQFQRSADTAALLAKISARHEYQVVDRSLSLQYQGSALCCDCSSSTLYQTDLNDCFNSNPEVESDFSWTILLIDGTAIRLSGVDLQASFLYIPAYTLLSGYSYVISVQATSQQCSKLNTAIQLENSQSVSVFINQNPPYPVIEGGDKTLSRSWDGNSQYFALNASRSKNMDFPDRFIAQKALKFLWNCTYRSHWSVLGWQSCDSSIFRGGSLCNTSICVLDLNGTEIDMTYIFTVTVSPLILLWEQPLQSRSSEICTYSQFLDFISAGMDVESISFQCAANFSLSQQASVQIHMVGSKVPKVSVDIVSPVLSKSETYDIDPNVYLTVSQSNIHESVTFKGQIFSSLKITSIKWRLENYPAITCQNPRDWCYSSNVRSKQTVVSPGILEDVAGKDGCNSQDISSSGCSCLLSIYPYILKGLGVYNFSFTAVDANGESARASILLKINLAPYGGALQISPTSGIALKDTFFLAASGWFDPELPNYLIDNYRFVYRDESCLSADCEVVITSSQRSIVSTLLPPGNITIFVYVSDSLGATAVSGGQLVRVQMPSFAQAQAAINQYFKSPPQDVFQQLCLLSGLGILSKTGVIQASTNVRTNSLNLIRNSILKLGWTQTYLNTSEFVALDLQAARSISLMLSYELSADTKLLAFQMLYEIGSVVLGLSLPFGYLREASILSDQLSQFSNFLFGPSKSSRIYQKDEQSLKLFNYYYRRSGQIEMFKDERIGINALKSDLAAVYQQTLNLLDFIQLISKLGGTNLLPGGMSFHQNDVFYEITKRDTGLAIIGETLNIPISNIFTCLSSDDVGKCCLVPSSMCCFGSTCDGSTALSSPLNSAIIPVQSTGLNMLEVYDILFANLGNQFSQLTSDSLLTSSLMIRISSISGASFFSPNILFRIYMSQEAANYLVINSITTVQSQGYFAACQQWEFQTMSWTSNGIQNYRGNLQPQKMCKFNKNVNQTQCVYFMECLLTGFSTSKPSIVGIARRELDCSQSPLGIQRYDACGVCGGINSTCSGCDNIPYERAFGDILTKDCSGHGTCSGGPTCKCCADGIGSISAAQGQTCPWFGMMCNLFCTSSPVSDNTKYSSSKNWMHCNSHGQCGYDAVSGTMFCRCDSGYIDKNDSIHSRCGFAIPIIQQDDPNYLMFLKVGIPVLAVGFCFVIFACVYARRVRIRALKGRETIESVVLKLPKPTLEEIGAPSQQQGVVVTQKGKLRPKLEASLKKKAAARLAEEAKLDRIGMDLSLLPRDPRNVSIPAASVSAFVTTSRFEVDSDVVSSDDFALKTTFQRLAKLRSNVQSNPTFSSPDRPSADEIFQDKDIVSAMIKSGSRHPVSLSHPEASKFGKPPKSAQGNLVVQTELNARQREVSAQSQYGPSRLNLPHFVRERMKSERRDQDSDSDNEAFV